MDFCWQLHMYDQVRRSVCYILWLMHISFGTPEINGYENGFPDF